MMKITRIEWVGVRVPFRRPLVMAGGVAEHRYGLLLFVGTDSGITGLGEASPVGAGSAAEVLETAKLLEGLAPELLNVPVSEALDTVSPLPSGGSKASGGGPRSKTPAVGAGLRPPLGFGLETALYDALGKQLGRPLAALLRGVLPDAVRRATEAVAVNALVAVDTAREAARLAAEAVAQGFSTVKLKLGARTPEEEEALARAVREAIGKAPRLRCDANGAWGVDEAIGAIQRLEQFDLEYVEQPVAAGDIQGMARVRRSVGVPIAADESLAGLDDARRLLNAGAADVLVVKAARAGGLRAAGEIMALADAHGLTAVVTSSLETGVGIAASLHLAATVSEGKSPACGLATASLLEHDLLTRPLTPVGGALAVPQGPGLGVELDMEEVRRYGMGVQGSVGG